MTYYDDYGGGSYQNPTNDNRMGLLKGLVEDLGTFKCDRCKHFFEIRLTVDGRYGGYRRGTGWFDRYLDRYENLICDQCLTWSDPFWTEVAAVLESA